MIAPTKRGGKVVLAVSAVLLLIFAGLLAFQKFYANKEHQQADSRLIEELADAVFIDEAPAESVDWPRWRGRLVDGFAHAPNLPTRWPKEGPPKLWEMPAGLGYSALSVAGDRVFTLVSEDGGEAVICWNASDGKELWRFPYQSPALRQYPGPRSTPTVDGDRVYTVGGSGEFHCLDAATGKLRWKHDLRDEFKAQGGQWGHAFSPLVEGQLVITAPGGPGASIVAFDKDTGNLAWKALDDRPGYSSPIGFSAGGVRQVICFMGNSLVGVAPADGKLLWRIPWQTNFEVNAATPLIFHARKGEQVLDYIFISSGYSRGCALIKLEKTQAGDFVASLVFENNKLCSHFSSPVRRGADVYGFNESTLVCMDLRTGDIRWHENGYQKGSLLRVDDYLLVLGERGKLALLDASPQKSPPLATAQPLQGKCWTMPVLAGGRLFLRNEEKAVCLDLRKKG
jgi:hypothetical protein